MLLQRPTYLHGGKFTAKKKHNVLGVTVTALGRAKVLHQAYVQSIANTINFQKEICPCVCPTTESAHGAVEPSEFLAKQLSLGPQILREA